MIESATVKYERYDIVDPRHKNLLLVEDSEADIELVKDLFSQSKYPHSLFVVRDGEGAIAFLKSDLPTPHLILLDINMPRIGGFETLEFIKNNPATAKTPVLMLTTSEANSDIGKAKEGGACGYLPKPNACQVEELISIIDLYEQDPELFIKVKPGTAR